jgi:hypothetical protein
MSRCTVCDERLPLSGQDTRCDRCADPCTICGGDVALCHHSLTPPELRAENKDKWVDD